MNGGIIPSLMLSATIALLLSFTTGRAAWLGVAGMAATAFVLALVAFPQSLSPAIFISVWGTIIVAAVLIYLPPSNAQRWSIPVAVAAGASIGALSSLSGRKSDLLALPISLLFVPGRWIVARGYGLGIKIAGSWMISIALLSAFVSLTPTPGYKPDHME